MVSAYCKSHILQFTVLNSATYIYILIRVNTPLFHPLPLSNLKLSNGGPQIKECQKSCCTVLYHDTVVDVRVADMCLIDYDVPDVMAVVEYSIKCFLLYPPGISVKKISCIRCR